MFLEHSISLSRGNHRKIMENHLKRQIPLKIPPETWHPRLTSCKTQSTNKRPRLHATASDAETKKQALLLRAIALAIALAAETGGGSLVPALAGAL